MSDYSSLHKQVVFTNLSDTEIEKLIDILNSKRSNGSKKNPKSAELSNEERAFLQCCRENRENEKGEISCPKCGTFKDIRPYGKYKGRQRYRCRLCGRTFADTVGTVLYRSKLSISTWIQFIRFVLQGESCRTISRELHINKSTVLYNRHRICSILREFTENKDKFPSMAEGDEYYYGLSFKDIKDPSFFVDTLGRMPFTHMSRTKRYEYVAQLGYDEDFVEELKMLEIYRKNSLMAFVDEEDLKSQTKFSRAVNAMEKPKCLEVLKTLDEQQKKKVGISNQQVCILTCVDPTHNHYLQSVCVGRIQPKHIEKTLVPHFTKDTILVTDSHSAYKRVANKRKIPLRQIPSGKHTSNGYSLAHINGYHRNVSGFFYPYQGVSTKYLPNYLSLFYWKEKHKDLTYEDQAYEIISLLAMQAKKIPLNQFKNTPITIDLKGILGHPQRA